MKSLNNINRLVNLLLSKYSFKISREGAKRISLKHELGELTEFYNKMNENNEIKICQEEFENEYIKPFFNSLNLIKEKLVQYKCRMLPTPFDINIESSLYYFLVDESDSESMYLASAYENMIDWQNTFLNLIISKNESNGPLSDYISQLKQEINIQDATKDEILNIDEKTYKFFNELIMNNSMRNIIKKDNKINYENYNDIIYDFDYIEKRLAKSILTGKKKFKSDIKFIIYSFEEFAHSSMDIYNFSKYGNKDLQENEKKFLFNFICENKNSEFYLDVYKSLFIVMNENIKENYNTNITIYETIINFPSYIVLNEKLVNFFKYNYEDNKTLFLVESLFPIFEIFEALCWDNIATNILPDYKLKLPEESKERILKYFKENKNKEKIIDEENFASALRIFMSRIISSVKNELKLVLCLSSEMLWKKNISENEKFYEELHALLDDQIKVGHSFYLYELFERKDLMKIEKEINTVKEKESDGQSETSKRKKRRKGRK